MTRREWIELLHAYGKLTTGQQDALRKQCRDFRAHVPGPATLQLAQLQRQCMRCMEWYPDGKHDLT